MALIDDGPFAGERNYLDEAIKIMTGETMLLPERQHLLALREYYQVRITRERERRLAERQQAMATT